MIVPRLANIKSELKAKDINIAIIDVDVYYVTRRSKKAQVFAILIKNIEYQVEKELRARTNLQDIIP